MVKHFILHVTLYFTQLADC